MRHRHKDFWDQPWVLIAVVVGVVAVIAIALLFFFGGGGGSSGASSAPLPVTTARAGQGPVISATVTPVKTTPLSAATTTKAITIRETTPASVPVEGVYVKVSYLGGYSGTYGTGGIMEKITGSGDRVYAVNTTGGTLQAIFQKRDGSASHDLVVEIWKGGKAIISQKNSSAYGIVSLSSAV